MKHCMSIQMTYIICTNIYLHMATVHMVKVICKSTYEPLYVYVDDLYHLQYLSHLQKYLWTIVRLCRWLISSALTYSYTFWQSIWLNSSAEVHIKHCIYMQITYIICSNIFLHIWLCIRFKFTCTSKYVTYYVYADYLYHLH
jgi:hypothetical protein